METKLNPNKFEEMVTPLYAQIKEIESQINAIGLQALAECYEILSKNPKGNCILINPDSEDLVLNQENFAIWAIGAFDGTIHVKNYTEYVYKPFAVRKDLLTDEERDKLGIN